MALFDSIRLGSSAAGDYEIERSLRFNDDDNAHLSRTPSSASNRKTWTISAWVKRGNLGSSNKTLFNAYDGSSSRRFRLFFGSNDQIEYNQGGNANSGIGASTAKFRDINAWYHFVFVADYTNATAADRFKVYVNGSEISMSFSDDVENADGQWNGNWEHDIGIIGSSTGPFDGYMAEINVIDGQALTPSSFAETDAVTGEYKPKKYAGSYGTSGFYLNFSDNSGTTATTLGKDSSGNGNNFTPNNFSVAAGAGNDSVEDTPTNNFSTFSPLLTDQRSGAVYSEGNTKVVTGSGAGTIGSSFAVSSGKWYAEFKCTAKTSVNMGVGIQTVTGYDGERQWNESQNGGFGIAYLGGDNASSGNKMTDGGGTASYGASYVVNDIIGVALDVDNKTVNFYKNNSAQGTIDITTTKGDFYVMTVGHGQGGCTNTWEANFGQRAFSYTPPTGFVAMNSANLPDPTIKLPDKHFNTLLYTGNGGTQSITGLEFQPDWVWLKKRNGTTNHLVFDSVRGTNKSLNSNGTGTEDTSSTNKLTSFNSDGFTLGSNASGNNNSDTYVGWNWKGGGSASSNSNGSITSSVSANTSAGFSIVSYTGNGSSGATIGHGLGVAPDVYIVKRRDGSNSWQMFHQALGNQKFLELHDSGAEQTSSNRWNNTSPTSTVFTVGDNSNVNSNGGTGIAYCFSEVAGYSKFGSYTGNGSSDGTFVFTGFRPAWILAKRSSSSENWALWDNKRDGGFNPNGYLLRPDSSTDEGGNDSGHYIDILSNGFKFRNTDSKSNSSGDTYIYLAFAETPFKYSRAR